MFQETADRTNFQGRYVVRHAWTGDSAVRRRHDLSPPRGRAPGTEAQRLAELTGWTVTDIRKKMGLGDKRPSATSRLVGADLAIGDKAEGRRQKAEQLPYPFCYFSFALSAKSA